MAGNRQVLSLREAGISLIDCDHRTPPASGAGYPYVTIPQLKDGRLDLKEVRRISSQHFAEWTRKARPAPNDVVLSRRCNPGETAFVSEGMEFALGQNLVLLRANGKKIYPPFLRWLVRGPDWQDQVQRFINVGAVFDSLKCADIPGFELSIPPLDEQRRITDILSALDDKIELNRQMNETLEAMARVLFKSWFIDFDPVRRKAEGLDLGLPAAIADLFPARLVGSEIGDIPEGWLLRSLDEVAHFLNGLALQKYPPVKGQSLPVIKIVQLRAGNTVGADLASATLHRDYVVEDGDILFSWSGSLECVLWAGGRGALNQHLFKVIATKYPKWLCYLAIHHHLDEFRHIAAGKATTMGHIQRHHLAEAKLAMPPKDVLRAIDAPMAPMIESIWRRQVQSRTLGALRDALLPKLISGEIRVTEAEKSVGRVMAEAI
jgi:type I restriction enzyme, S subunit